MIENIKSALTSIWSNKVRSLLTVLGVVIGVTSVTTLVAMGQGLKNDVSALIEGLGTNIVAVTAGKIDLESGEPASPAAFIATDILTPSDVQKLQALEGVAGAVPLGIVPGTAKSDGLSAAPVIVGTDSQFFDVMEVLRVKEGRRFADSESGVTLLATAIADKLFPGTSALAKKVTVGTTEFTVIGVLEEESKSSVFGSEFSTMMVIPFADATTLNKGKVTINRIIIKAESAEAVAGVKERTFDTLLEAHNGEEDFTVLTQEDILDLFDDFLTLATAMVSAIAAISLIVGGIGIMNIMLVTVTERTREIGLRKAVGAPSSAILLQFLVEAIAVTLLGGIIGLGLSLGIGVVVTAQTPLTPSFTPQVIATAMLISVVIGAIFGIWPAMRAARKDPIEALRYE